MLATVSVHSSPGCSGCYFAEDTGIFAENQFTNAVGSHTLDDGSDTADFIKDLFAALDEADPANQPAHLAQFPYVNGRLFRSSTQLTVPRFSAKARELLIALGTQIWLDINPDIFGSMFQAIVTPPESAPTWAGTIPRSPISSRPSSCYFSMNCEKSLTPLLIIRGSWQSSSSALPKSKSLKLSERIGYISAVATCSRLDCCKLQMVGASDDWRSEESAWTFTREVSL